MVDNDFPTISTTMAPPSGSFVFLRLWLYLLNGFATSLINLVKILQMVWEIQPWAQKNKTATRRRHSSPNRLKIIVSCLPYSKHIHGNFHNHPLSGLVDRGVDAKIQTRKQ